LCLATNQAEGRAAGYEMALSAGGIGGEGWDVLSERGQGDTNRTCLFGSATENTAFSA